MPTTLARYLLPPPPPLGGGGGYPLGIPHCTRSAPTLSSFFCRKIFLFCTLFSLTPGRLSSANAKKNIWKKTRNPLTVSKKSSNLWAWETSTTSTSASSKPDKSLRPSGASSATRFWFRFWTRPRTFSRGWKCAEKISEKSVDGIGKIP